MTCMSLTQAPSIRVLEDYEFMIYVRSEMTIYATLIMFSAGTQQWSQDWNKFQNRILLQSSADFPEVRLRFLCLCRNG